MDDSQESTGDFKFDSQSDDIEYEREIQILERDIRQQKESSVNAKTAITFDQLRKIHTLSQYLGPMKEHFFDRICRAAEIQRASLKNRLKQNKERFEPTRQIFDSQSSIPDSQFTITPTTIHSLLQSRSMEDELKFPPNRQFDLLSLGFSYFELRAFMDCFESFKCDNQEFASKNQLIQQFANFISINPPENVRNISMAFNLLELGNSVKDIRHIVRVRPRLPDSESTNDDDPSPPKRLKSNSTSPRNDQEQEQEQE